VDMTFYARDSNGKHCSYQENEKVFKSLRAKTKLTVRGKGWVS
jgi:hypothetical protein